MAAILVPEDNVVNQKLALKFFEKLGYKADLAENGRKAVEGLERKKYDVIFMDIQMPVMSGIEATELIVQKWGAARPRIVACTANAMKEDRDKCFELGMDDYITKPIKVEELKRVLLDSYAKTVKADQNVDIQEGVCDLEAS